MYDATVYFCDHFIDKRSRTHDQMIQAARSGKQNVIEIAGNVIIGLIRVSNFLLDRQFRQLEKAFLEEGGLRERMTHARLDARRKPRGEPRNRALTEEIAALTAEVPALAHQWGGPAQ